MILGIRTDVPQAVLGARCGNPHSRPRGGAIVRLLAHHEYAHMAQVSPIPKSRRGDVIQNSVTGERAIVLVGSADSPDGKTVGFLGVRPGGAVVGEHIHPSITEHFRVVSGRLCVRINGAEAILGPGDEATIPPGVPHDWWN